MNFVDIKYLFNKDYKKHFVLGMIYTRIENEKIDERRAYTIDQLQSIASVVKEIDFFVQEKYKIAKDRPGSGNTKNIGSTTKINDLKNGTGAFSNLGLNIFDDYWMNYMTNDMARAVDLPKPPYKNLKEYFEQRKRYIQNGLLYASFAKKKMPYVKFLLLIQIFFEGGYYLITLEYF